MIAPQALAHGVTTNELNYTKKKGDLSVPFSRQTLLKRCQQTGLKYLGLKIQKHTENHCGMIATYFDGWQDHIHNHMLDSCIWFISECTGINITLLFICDKI
jgi:peptide deformylase